MEYHHSTIQNHLSENKNLKIMGGQYRSTECFMN